MPAKVPCPICGHKTTWEHIRRFVLSIVDKTALALAAEERKALKRLRKIYDATHPHA